MFEDIFYLETISSLRPIHKKICNNKLLKKKQKWNLDDFNQLFAILVLYLNNKK